MGPALEIYKTVVCKCNAYLLRLGIKGLFGLRLGPCLEKTGV